ncbi:MAG: tetratricopeptide repeat protein [Acidobacteriota bacterium]
MSFLRKILGLDASSHVARGDAFSSQQEWGLAHLEYEKALDAAEGAEETASVERKVRESAEKLHERNLDRAAAAEENGDLSEALTFCQGASDVLPPGDERRAVLESRIEGLALRIDEADLKGEIESFLNNENPPEMARTHRHWLIAAIPSGSDDATERQYTSPELIELAGEAADGEPNQVVTYAMALAQAGFTTHAIAAFKRAAALRPDDKEVHYFLGNLHGDQGDLDLAVLELERAIEIDPRYDLAYLYLARTYLRVEDDEAAEPLLRKALEVASEESGVPEECRELLSEISARKTKSDEPDTPPESLDERIP